MAKAKLIEFLAAGLADSNGNPLSGYKVRTFAADGATAQVVWQDRDKTLPTAAGLSAFVLDATGRYSAYGDGVYTVKVWTPAADPDVDSAYKVYSGVESRSFSGATETVDTIADLRLSNGSSGESRTVLGYYAAGDGGGGPMRIWKSGAAPGTYVDNGGSVVVPTGDDGSAAWVWELSGAVNVRWFGTVNSPIVDSTAAVQSAVSYVAGLNAGLFFPSGYYKLTAPISVPAGETLDIYGEGRSTHLLQATDSAVFTFSAHASRITFRDFLCTCVVPVTGAGDTLGNKALFYFPEGNSRSLFENIVYINDAATSGAIGGSYYVNGTDKFNDEVTFQNCFATVKHWGYKIGKGSSIFINSGRIIGSYPEVTTGYGLYLSGGNGGVWVNGTDFINHGKAIYVTADNGETNREIFLTHACVDSSYVGLEVIDNSYVSWVGVWAASCDWANILFAPASDSAELNMSGGIVFNAGRGWLTTALMVGMEIQRFGRVLISGVTFKANKFRAISFASGARDKIAEISGCRFEDNGDIAILDSGQISLAGAAKIVNNTLIQGTGDQNVPIVLTDPATITKSWIAGNEGFIGHDLRTGPALPSTNTIAINQTGQRLRGYIREGLVSVVYVNEIPQYFFNNGPANCVITLNPRETFKITYSSEPLLVWYFD